MADKETKYTALDYKKHGVGGVINGGLIYRDQDKKAKALEMYCVVFFPKIRGIGTAQIAQYEVLTTLSQTPEAAKVKFMDRIALGQTWAQYQRAGHRIRKLRVADLGDATAPRKATAK